MTAARDLALETLQLKQEGRVLTARFSNPPLNFMTTGFIRELDQLTRSVDRDPTVGAVVLTGGVEGRFLTHLDAQELAGIGDLPHPKLSMRAAAVVAFVLNVVLWLPGVASLLERFGGAPGKGIVMGYRWKRMTLRMNRSAAVYVAAINGPVLDGGLEIVLACDLRYATDAAPLRMGQMEMLVALIPGGGGSQRLLRMLGPARALEYVLEGVPLTGQEALEYRPGASGRARDAAPHRGPGHRRAARATVADGGSRAQALSLLRYGSQPQPGARPGKRRFPGGRVDEGCGRRPEAVHRGLRASRRHAVPRRSEAMDRGDAVRSSR